LFRISYIVWGNVILARKIRRLRSIHLKIIRAFCNWYDYYLYKFYSYRFIESECSHPGFSLFFIHDTYFCYCNVSLYCSGQIPSVQTGEAAQQRATYSILSALSFVIYYFVIRAASASLKQLIGIKSSTLEGILVVALILVILPFAKLLQNLFDQIFNKTLRQYRKSMLVLFRKLQTYYETSEFFEIVTQFLISNFKISEVYIFNYQPQSGHFTEIREKTQAPPIPRDCALSTHLKHKKGATEFYDELTHRDLDSDCHQFFEDIHALDFCATYF